MNMGRLGNYTLQHAALTFWYVTYFRILTIPAGRKLTEGSLQSAVRPQDRRQDDRRNLDKNYPPHQNHRRVATDGL